MHGDEISFIHSKSESPIRAQKIKSKPILNKFDIYNKRWVFLLPNGLGIASHARYMPTGQFHVRLMLPIVHKVPHKYSKLIIRVRISLITQIILT